MKALQRKELAVSDLLLDPDNPRLPEDIQGADQSELLEYLNNEASLDELVRSLNDNGFFDHEPLIAYRDAELDGYVVLEGNRRLAALKIVLGSAEARDLGLTPLLDAPPTKERLDDLRQVPVYVVDDRDDVHRYLGFRHIGGIKTWSAEAKARYLLDESDKAAARDESSPFLVVARRVGTNTQSVRNSYTALALLRFARDEYSIPTTYVAQNRFGVWLRCMSAQNVRHYIGLNGARSYEATREEIEQVDEQGLREVVEDLTPQAGEKRPLLNDSRDVTAYGRILQHETARTVMREYRNLSVAKQIVDLADLHVRILSLRDQVDIATDEARRADPSKDLTNAAEALFESVRFMRAAIRALDEDDAR